MWTHLSSQPWLPGLGLGWGGGPAKHVSKGDQINMCLLYINHFLHFFFPEVKCHLSVWAPLLCSYKTMIKCVPVCMCVCDVCVRVLSACVWGECMCVCVCVCVHVFPNSTPFKIVTPLKKKK